MSQDTLTLLSIFRSKSTIPGFNQTTDSSSPLTDETISGTENERALWAQLRNSAFLSAPDDPGNELIESDEKYTSTESWSMTLLNVRIKKITDTKLFNLRRRFANILGADYAVALGHLEGPIFVMAFGTHPPSLDQVQHFRQYEDIELIHAPLACLDDFDKITIVNGLNSIMVTATPGRVFTPAGGWHEEFYLKTCEELDFDSILGLRIESGGPPLL